MLPWPRSANTSRAAAGPSPERHTRSSTKQDTVPQAGRRPMARRLNALNGRRRIKASAASARVTAPLWLNGVRGQAALLTPSSPTLPQLMNTGSPRISRIITMVLFALSCVGLLLFLWLSFGGRFRSRRRGTGSRSDSTTPFDLADYADVRIAGVDVGKVVGQEHVPRTATGRSPRFRWTISSRPIHRNATSHPAHQDAAGRDLRPDHARPRATLLRCLTGATLPDSRVVNSVQLDDVFNTFDPQNPGRPSGPGSRSWPQAVRGNVRTSTTY